MKEIEEDRKGDDSRETRSEVERGGGGNGMKRMRSSRGGVRQLEKWVKETAETKKAKNSGEYVKGKRFISGGPLAVSPSTCREHRQPDGGGVTNMWHIWSHLWTEKCEVNIQRAEVKPSIKNNEVSAAETVCAFHAVVFMLLPFPRTPSLFWTTGQSFSIDRCTASSMLSKMQLEDWLTQKKCVCMG